MNRPQFQPQQARLIAAAFEREGVDYLFIGKSGAVLLGFRRYPGRGYFRRAFARKRASDRVRLARGGIRDQPGSGTGYRDGEGFRANQDRAV